MERRVCFSGVKGLTLIEVLLAVSVIAIIAVATLPLFIGSIGKNKLDLTKMEAAQAVRRAMLKSQANERDSAWGVKFLSGSIVIFKGASYSQRDAAFDQVIDVERGVSFTGATEIDFSRFTGEISATSTINIVVDSDGQTKSLIVNPKGALTY